MRLRCWRGSQKLRRSFAWSALAFADEPLLRALEASRAPRDGEFALAAARFVRCSFAPVVRGAVRCVFSEMRRRSFERRAARVRDVARFGEYDASCWLLPKPTDVSPSAPLIAGLAVQIAQMSPVASGLLLRVAERSRSWWHDRFRGGDPAARACEAPARRPEATLPHRRADVDLQRRASRSVLFGESGRGRSISAATSVSCSTSFSLIRRHRPARFASRSWLQALSCSW